MEIKQTGVILYTEAYEATVDFYKKIFGLSTLYQKENLTCLDFNGSYLMIELDDTESLNKENIDCREKFCLRFNVENVKLACEKLDAHSIAYDYNEFDWGQLAKFRDPDGNFVGIKSSKEHEEDIKK